MCVCVCVYTYILGYHSYTITRLLTPQGGGGRVKPPHVA